ncbi:hypothetical protein JOF53_003089 [Crossiella equi]|uniref:Uncharacterized protein n=1 Tax=Crossiella equi TaxID=130796 RepID=A0ABS5ACB1_9PSEU|nr:hypothetical protein [Crossiella equi]MBP2474217.1 hypothetical protein [Crossiella equi]
MSRSTWLFTPLVAVLGTLAGVLVLYFGEAALVPWLAGPESPPCGQPDCVLGVGLQMTLAAVVVVLVALIAGLVLGHRRREGADRGTAVLRGFVVCGYCLLAYAIQSVVAWWPK